MKIMIRLARPLLSCALLLVAARVASAQETFKINGASRVYNLSVRVAGCGGAERDDNPNNCSGAARVQIYRKGAKTPFQVLNLANVELYKDTLTHNPETSAKPRGLYAEEYGFVFDDFDFDGDEDLAVCNGRNSGYGGPSYNVFIFDGRTRRFTENKRLTALAEGAYLGLFFPDRKTKQLVALSKSGCCYHETEKYKVINNRPVLVEKIIEDATLENDAGERFVLVTTKKRVGGRWVVRKKKQKREEGNE